MDSINAYQGLAMALSDVQDRIADMAELGKQKALAERSYRIALRQRMLEERRKSTPMSIINDVVRGYCDISLLAYNRDIAVTLYEANLEALLVAKKLVDTYREILAREWAEARVQ